MRAYALNITVINSGLFTKPSFLIVITIGSILRRGHRFNDSAQMGVVFVKELQGDDPRYLKLVATPKHYAVHSGPERDRHRFDAVVDERDMRDTYLPAFEACIKEGGAVSIMGAYNRVNGEPACASPTLLQRILREEWGFGGPDGLDAYVVSDCWAIIDIYAHHKVVATPEQAAALAVK